MRAVGRAAAPRCSSLPPSARASPRSSPARHRRSPAPALSTAAAAARLEGRLQHQILGRIAADIELGARRRGRRRARRPRPARRAAGEIAVDVAHARVELGERDGERSVIIGRCKLAKAGDIHRRRRRRHYRGVPAGSASSGGRAVSQQQTALAPPLAAATREMGPDLPRHGHGMSSRRLPAALGADSGCRLDPARVGGDDASQPRRRSFIWEEGTNAELARHILATGNLLDLTLYGKHWVEKPPALPWLIAATAAITGQVEMVGSTAGDAGGALHRVVGASSGFAA